MNPLDIAVVALIVLSAIFAFARGFVREALSIVAWVGAAIITLYGFNQVYSLVDPLVKNPLLSQLIAGFGLFIGSLVVFTIVTSIIARSVRTSALSPIDRTLGFIFGLARGVFVVSLAYLLLDLMVPLPNDRPDWVREAKSGPYLHQGAEMLRGWLPEQFKLRTAGAGEEVIRAVSPAIEAERARRALVNPSPPAVANKPEQPASPPPPPSYSPAERRNLDRVIGTQR